MEMKQILASGGVSAADFADLAGVTRNMVHKWLNGASPHSLRADSVAKLLAAITSAVESGDLPLELPSETRRALLRQLIIAHLKK